MYYVAIAQRDLGIMIGLKCISIIEQGWRISKLTDFRGLQLEVHPSTKKIIKMKGTQEENDKET